MRIYGKQFQTYFDFLNFYLFIYICKIRSVIQLEAEAQAAKSDDSELYQRKAKLLPKYLSMQTSLESHLIFLLSQSQPEVIPMQQQVYWAPIPHGLPFQPYIPPAPMQSMFQMQTQQSNFHPNQLDSYRM
jgi:hypothetical protein